ncbi:MAG: hypothetical protein IKK75_07750 [Clostridia bacterium]|nr:hypothetical protein [Clostridia bacterium]
MTKWIALLLCLLMLPSFALAQTTTYVYGGSGFDSLGGMAVSADDRIVMTGITESSDGTLETRTKTGQCGWVLCIDKNGEVLWNFCRHTAKYERMEAPAFHADGSVTVVFWTEQSGIGKLELIRLSPDGEMLSILPLTEAADNMTHVRACGIEPDTGYVVLEMDKRTQSSRYRFYDWEGQFLCELADYEGEVPFSAVLSDGTLVSTQDIEQNVVDVLVTFESQE